MIDPLPRLAGYRRAAELFLLARVFTSAEAKEIGLVNRILPPTNCCRTRSRPLGPSPRSHRRRSRKPVPCSRVISTRSSLAS